MKNPEIKRWIQWAKLDLESAELLFNEKFFEQSIFHCHESAEKLLKALIQYQGNRYPYVHNIEKLITEAKLDKNDSIVINNAASILENLYPIARYPTKDKINKGQTQSALAATTKIQNIILKYLK